MPRTVARLPKAARAEFKDPLGRIYTEPQELLADAGDPVIAVGDVVTYHLERVGATPHVSVVDGRTEREAVEAEIVAGLPDADTDVHVASDPATLSHELVEALVDAIQRNETTLIVVDGEEDLASLPAVVAAPIGASVVYGQPGEGMVLVNVDADVKARTRDLLALLETEEEFWALLDAADE